MAGGMKGHLGGAVLHGEGKSGARSKEFRAWLSMRLRCRQHPHYLKHGVIVCARWEASYPAFLEDVGRAPSASHSLDRWPNADGQYEPGNVRWATRIQQRANRRAGSKVSRFWLGRKRKVERLEDGRLVVKGAA